MRVWWCLVVSLLTWHVRGQAPDDYDQNCRTGNNEALHDLPEDWVLLLDSFDYNNLLISGSNPVWQSVDIDGDGNRWTQNIGGACTWNLFALFLASGQNNWVFTQYISYRDAVEVFFRVGDFDFGSCVGNPACLNPYATLYRYDTDQLSANSPAIRDTNNYDPLFGSVTDSRLQAGQGSSLMRTFLRPDASGFYLGIQDEGTSGTVGRIQVYYRVARGRTEDLLTCPDVPLPAQGSSDMSERLCMCLANANQTSSTLRRICNAEGECNEDQQCACSPGFQLTESMCTACPENTYKSDVSNSSCLACPLNSESRGEGNSVCDCIPPNIRDPGRPQDPCTTPPSPPRLILAGGGAPRVNQDSITVCWLPALDSGGLDDLRYNIYLYDSTLEEPTYQRANDEGIVQEGGDNICYDVSIENTDTSYGVLVVSANGATGDLEQLTNVQEVQDRFVAFFVALRSDLAAESQCNSAQFVSASMRGLFLCVIALLAVLA